MTKEATKPRQTEPGGPVPVPERKKRISHYFNHEPSISSVIRHAPSQPSNWVRLADPAVLPSAGDSGSSREQSRRRGRTDDSQNANLRFILERGSPVSVERGGKSQE